MAATRTSTVGVYIMTDITRSYTLLKEYEDIAFRTTSRIIAIPLPIRFVSNVRWYKIKITVDGLPISISSIERRFRVYGRSR